MHTKIFATLIAITVMGAQIALAGAPLKGIDVKLGKNPGGGCAARTRSDTCLSQHASAGDGSVSFSGAEIPEKGNYVIGISPPSGSASLPAVHIVISGIKGGDVLRDFAASASDQILVSLNGDERIMVSVTAQDPNGPRQGDVGAAKVKEHSNTNNN